MKDAAGEFAPVLRDVVRLLERVRLVPHGDGATPAISHADLWRVLPRLMRRVADLGDVGRLPPGSGWDAKFAATLRDSARLIELSPPPAGGDL